GQDADPLQPLRVGAAGADVVEEELAVQEDVVAGQEGLDASVDRDAGFLPEEITHIRFPLLFPGRSAPCARRRVTRGVQASSAHRLVSEASRRGSMSRAFARMARSYRGMPSSSLKPRARLRFCMAWVAAPLSRLSRVATTTTRRPPGATVNPPTCTPCRPAIRLTQGASSTISTSGSPAYRLR